MAESLPAGPPAGRDIETDHEYDGIREFDNPLPRWWLLTLWGSIIFSMGYWFYYHNIEGQPGSYEVLAAEMVAVEELRVGPALSDEELLALTKDAAVLESGKATFMTYCLACHGPDGGGTVGPNLTDAYRIHGHTPGDALRVVTSGIPAKGMAAWKPVLGAAKVRDVTAYVLTLPDSPVEGKAPQGKDASGKEAPPL